MIDILEIRDRLNQVPFRQGRRQVFIGRISDVVELPQPNEEQDEANAIEVPAEVRDYLRELEATLERHDLALLRGDEDTDALYAVQQLRSQSNGDLSWMSEAIGWASRITTVALGMVVPGIIGYWLDGRFKTGPVLSLIGFALGIVLGIRQLMQMTKSSRA